MTLDDSGRIKLPQEFVTAFSKGAVITLGERPCVEIYPVEAWRKIIKEFEQVQRPWPEEFEWQLRQKTMWYKETELKMKARITLPKEHREYARLKSNEEVLVVGMLDHLEVWSQDKYKDAEELYRAQRLFKR